MKKMLVFCLVIMMNLLVSNKKVQAEANIFEYDLSNTELVSYETNSDEGEEMIIEIEKIPSKERVAKGTYKVSKTLKGKWTISYRVTINNKNKITGASGLIAKALSGSFTSTSLTNNSTSATCSFRQKIGTLNSSGKIVASISKGKLVVK